MLTYLHRLHTDHRYTNATRQLDSLIRAGSLLALARTCTDSTSEGIPTYLLFIWVQMAMDSGFRWLLRFLLLVAVATAMAVRSLQ
jgi:hypothetical protein